MTDINKIRDAFFKGDKDSLQIEIQSSPLEADQVQRILSLKSDFDTQKSARGGCSACRLRALMSKYNPMLNSELGKSLPPAPQRIPWRRRMGKCVKTIMKETSFSREECEEAYRSSGQNCDAALRLLKDK
jgi:hypothetical protein|tara:strand:- start:2502 stop:2891 length:390 start_codon:yes stop_codon:yes gene_type:complete